jgi:hypothetical protein
VDFQADIPSKDTAEDPQTEPNTTCIKLLRDIQKRKHEIEAECKYMEKQRHFARSGQFLLLTDREATASTIEQRCPLWL